ncbi:SigE family RNA polymerase sigma factor [Cryptosporangium minutisporangium]|uniref:SigE family RNA polymerase sigma factor n=1 Tax=Cryptosporangium minutisporangium TaxID=113569 RepID=A0ABP6T762_9ACTN
MGANGRDFGRFYADHFAGLCKQLYAYHGDYAEAQDLAQEAFTRAWLRWAAISRYDDPAAWVRQVAWRLAISRWRRARTALSFVRRQRELHAPPPGPEHVVLVRALATLPEKQRRAVVLHHLADLSVADIAEQEGVAVGTVKSWLHRARAALADQLDDRSSELGVPDGRYDDGRA